MADLKAFRYFGGKKCRLQNENQERMKRKQEMFCVIFFFRLNPANRLSKWPALCFA